MKRTHAFKIWFSFYTRWLKNSNFHSSHCPLEGLDILIKWTSNRIANPFTVVPSRAWEMPQDRFAAGSMVMVIPSEHCCFCLCWEELETPVLETLDACALWSSLWRHFSSCCGGAKRREPTADPTRGRGQFSALLDSKWLLQTLAPQLGDPWTMV